jgi:hypothetical protein
MYSNYDRDCMNYKDQTLTFWLFTEKVVLASALETHTHVHQEMNFYKNIHSNNMKQVKCAQ